MKSDRFRGFFLIVLVALTSVSLAQEPAAPEPAPAAAPPAAATATPAPDPLAAAPLSAVMAIVYSNRGPTRAYSIVRYVKALTAILNYEAAALEKAGIAFPLENASTDSFRTLKGLDAAPIVKWLDPLGTEDGAIRFGANNDYNAYFGDGWNADWTDAQTGSAPQFHGDPKAGWLWVNHEFISNAIPTVNNPPTGQHLTFARFLKNIGVLTNDIEAPTWPQDAIDTYVVQYKQQLGGNWIRIVKDKQTKKWSVDKSATNLRYDATSHTLLRVTGQKLLGAGHDDEGKSLPEGVAVGIMADCAGGQTPWGTIITAEENVQTYYGGLEACWNGDNRFIAGQGYDPGKTIALPTEPAAASDFGRHSNPAQRHAREVNGFLCEIDPGVAPDKFYNSAAQGGDGIGHRKIGSMGRAHWENGTFVTDRNGQLIDGQPIVLYAGDDACGGRVYKCVTRGVYSRAMNRAAIRALLDDGRVYVAHLADLNNADGRTLFVNGAPTGKAPTQEAPGHGRWIELSVTNQADVAPNAAALGSPEMKVGDALKDLNWNKIGGFADDDAIRLALFTASNKIGVMGCNRPEDVEWNARETSPRLYVSFTYNERQNAVDQNGVLIDPAVQPTTPGRGDKTGSIFAIDEQNLAAPAGSMTFTYWAAFEGSGGTGVFDVACPDNLMTDAEGGVWFCTDGNIKFYERADGLYYLDQDPKHETTYRKGIRVAAVPSDAEATGPAFNSDQTTIFLSVQHPGEDLKKYPSTWPQER